MGLPFIRNWCFKKANRDSSSFHCMALDNSFLFQYYFLGWPLILILHCLQHWLMDYMSEVLLCKYLTFYPSSFLGWYLFVKGGLKGRGGGRGKSVALQKLIESNDCQYQHDSFTPFRSVPWWPGPSESYFPEDLGTSGLSISLALSIFLFPLPKTAPSVQQTFASFILTLVLKSERRWTQFSGNRGWRCNMRYPMGQRALFWD